MARYQPDQGQGRRCTCTGPGRAAGSTGGIERASARRLAIAQRPPSGAPPMLRPRRFPRKTALLLAVLAVLLSVPLLGHAAGSAAPAQAASAQAALGQGASGQGASGQGASGQGASGQGASGQGASGQGASGQGASGQGA